MVFSGIILAGGRSSRMGVDKGLMDFNGQPLVKYAIELLDMFCNDIIISANMPDYERFGYPVVPDKKEGLGPAEGIISTLNKAKNEWCIILSCDVPFVTPSIINRLSEEIKNCNAVVPRHANGVEPLVAIYNKKFLKTFEECIGKGINKMQDILEKGEVCYVDFQEELDVDSHLFDNINSFSDIKEAGFGEQ
jgi:molybdopterin-guanine dinucleotide biosynthesis protein A